MSTNTGQFKKGNKSWNTGKKLGPSWNTGKTWSQEVKDKIKAGRAVTSPETRLKMSIAAKKRGVSKAALEACIKANTGKKHDSEWIEKVALKRRGQKLPSIAGKNHPNWQGGITKESITIRNSLEMKQWREAVFKRDDYTCQMCGVKGCKLNADHIQPFSLFPELRFVVSNGRTLCEPCHKMTPTFAGRIKKSNYQTT